MKTTQKTSTLFAFLLVAMALLLAVTQPVLGLVFVFLVPYWFFLANVPNAPLLPVRRVRKALPLFELPVFSPRPSPAWQFP
jgi:hypothetical protein